jgi:hypothetical protein
MMNKGEKKNLLLLLLETLDALDLGLCTVFFFLYGLPTWAFIAFVAVVPFCFTVAEFYPTMDLFAKKKMITARDISLIALFFLTSVYYVICLFLLHK